LTIGAHAINESRLGYTWQWNFYNNLSLGRGYGAQLGWKFGKADDFPGINFGNTNPYTQINPATNAVYKEHVFDPSDVLTLIRGKHILHFGGELLIYRDNSTSWGNINAGSLTFSGSYTQQWTVDSATGIASPVAGTGMEYADFLLGYANSWSAGVTPEAGARLKSPQMFIQDDYKIRPNLTINMGLRYQINHGWNEVRNNEFSFDPTVTNSETQTLGAYWYASTHANGRLSLQKNVFDTVLPRAGFAWTLNPLTTLRGGFGLYAYNWSLDTYGNGMGGPFGSSGSYLDSTNGVIPATKLDGSGTIFGTGKALPYTSFSTDNTRFNGQSAIYTQYHTPVPKIYQWNLAVQRQLASDYVAEMAYVGSHGYNLSFPTDLNQVPASRLSANDSAFRPYPVYSNITGSTNNAVSNYNSLQMSITKRMNNGLNFSFNYVWSHFLADMDSGGWGGSGGSQPYQIANNPGANYSNANFDVRHAFKGYAVYQLPFGKGKAFLNRSPWLNPVVGGWQMSGSLVVATGNPFTVYADQNTYALAGSAFPNWSGKSIKPQHRTIYNWYNQAAFLQPANGTFGNVRRNSDYGPGINLVNLSGSKTIAVPWEGVKLEFRIDAKNAFNHPSFGTPSTQLGGSSGPGTEYSNSSAISSLTVNGRSIQLAAHITF
jgi:hypothetical protein